LQLHLQGFPLVLIDKFLPGIPLSYVTTDNREAAHQLTRHLIDLGHRHIGYFSPNTEGTSTLAERYEGFLEAMSEAGLDFPDDYFIEPQPWKDVSGYGDLDQIRVLGAWMDAHPEISAVFASDDQLAQCMLVAVRAKGREVPDEFSIVCFDGPPVNGLFWSFTAALQDQERMAKCATDLVFAQIEKAALPDPSMVVPATIHYGQSSGPVPHYASR
jgi:DNA-binding LacI/PurR family transcriptional regulator